MNTTIQFALLTAPVLAMGALAWCAISDLRTYTIPNWACLAVACLWLADAALNHDRLVGPLLTGACILLLGFGLFARGLMGGGDVKLLPAAALWAGPHGLMIFAAIAGFAAAAVALVLLSPARRLLPAPPAEFGTPARALDRPMPFGVAIAAGGLWAVGGHLPAFN